MAYHVLVTGKTVSDEAQSILRTDGADLTFMQGPVTEAALIAEHAKRPVDAVVLRGPAPFTKPVLETMKGVRILAKHGAGIDSVDIEAATALGVAVMRANGANADAVAEHALALMLALCRELPQFDAALRKGGWKDLAYVSRDFRGRTVGIVSYGQIGQRTARLAAACGANVAIWSRSPVEPPPGMRFVPDLDALIAGVDIVSLHSLLTPDSRHLMDARRFALMKPGALFVNTARGGLVDEAALIDALRRGRVAGAGLDCFEQEPPDPENPLFSMPNVICTPHIAAATTDSTVQMGVIAAKNITSWMKGEVYDPANFVNPRVAKR